MPSLSQYGDAESYKIGSPEETAEWYDHDETGIQTQKFNYSIAKKKWRFFTKKLRLENGAKECIV